MNSYFDRNRTGAQGTCQLNVHVDDFIPEEDGANNVQSKAHTEAQDVIVRLYIRQ